MSSITQPARQDLAFDEATHTYTLNGVRIPSVTQVLADAGLVDSTWFTEEAAWRGSAVHLACRLEDEGELDEDTLDPAIAGYLDAYRKFKAESDFRPELIEHRVVHPAYGYAGTLDRTGTIEPWRVIGDLKSGQVYPWVACQLTGYALTFPNPRTFRRMAIRLKDDGTYSVTEYPAKTFQEDANDFLAALRISNFKRRH